MAWCQQAAEFDLSSKVFCGIHLRAMSQGGLMMSTHFICSEITLLKLLPHLRGQELSNPQAPSTDFYKGVHNNCHMWPRKTVKNICLATKMKACENSFPTVDLVHSLYRHFSLDIGSCERASHKWDRFTSPLYRIQPWILFSVYLINSLAPMKFKQKIIYIIFKLILVIWDTIASDKIR